MGLLAGLGSVVAEVTLALLPLVLVAVIANFTFLNLSRRERRKIAVGFVITVAGLALFLHGVNIAFNPVGRVIGHTLAMHRFPWLLIPLGLWLGTITALAEPSVLVMADTVDRVSAGSIPPRLFLAATAGAVGVFVALAMAKVLWGWPLLWILVPGYVLAFILVRLAPPAFTGLAFDGGGVATGPVTSTFMLAISLGIAEAVPGRDIVSDGFGLVALVFLAPVLSLSALGALSAYRARRAEEQAREAEAAEAASADRPGEG